MAVNWAAARTAKVAARNANKAMKLTFFLNAPMLHNNRVSRL